MPQTRYRYAVLEECTTGSTSRSMLMVSTHSSRTMKSISSQCKPQDLLCQTLSGLRALKGTINLVSIETHNYGTVDDDHRSRHVSEGFEFAESSGVLCDVLPVKLYSLLRKILFRLIAEHSTELGIYDDFNRHAHSPVDELLVFSSNL